ncbi:MAG: NUDIX hydrolase [Clostridia bacterium]|nr:NUDIX hydrolase [Clostridia bacterium]
MQFKEKTVNKNYVFKGRIINVRKDDIILPNGKAGIREVVEHGGGSCIVCEKDGKILLVKQYRYPYEQELLELPAGKLNVGEDPKETAIRELEEEGGIKCKKVEKLFEIYPSPGYTNEIIYIYKATDFVETKTHLDEDEFLTSAWYSKEELRKMIKNGEIKDAKTLIALLKILL